jgi:hypothetical protein
MRYIQQNGILVPRTARNRQRGFITCGPAFFGGAASSGGDPYWSDVVSLLYFNGTNGSTTFTDQVSGVTWAATNATISTAQSQFGGSSGAFTGNNSYIRATNSNFALGTGDFTLEWFVYWAGNTVTGSASASCVLDARTAEPSAQILSDIQGSGSGHPRSPTLYVSGSYRVITVADISTAFKHVALVRSSGVTNLYVGGVGGIAGYYIGPYTDSNNYSSTTWTLGGRFAAVSGDFRSLNGYLGEFRATKGIARYTANFTPPTTQWPNHA